MPDLSRFPDDFTSTDISKVQQELEQLYPHPHAEFHRQQPTHARLHKHCRYEAEISKQATAGSSASWIYVEVDSVPVLYAEWHI